MRRVYVHFADCVTVRLCFDDTTRVSDLEAAFLEAYTSNNDARASGGDPPAAVELRKQGGCVFADRSALLTAVSVCDGDDLTAIAVAAPPVAREEATARKEPVEEAKEDCLPQLVDELPEEAGVATPAPVPPPASLPSRSLQLSDEDATQLIARAQQLVDVKRLSAANKVYEQVLASLGNSSVHAPMCILALARNALAIDQPEKALGLLRKGVDWHPRHVALLTSMGDALLRVNRASDAVQCLNTALRVSRDATTPASSRGGLSTNDIQALCARALYAAGARQQAANVVMQVLQDTREGHIGALVEYAAISADQGNHGDVVSSLLRVLSASPSYRKDSRVQAMLATAASKEEGLNALFDRVCGPATGTRPDVAASALAYVANALKDAGAVTAAATVLQRACGSSVSSPGMALALAHSWEACHDTTAALEALRSWFRFTSGAAEGTSGAPANARTRPYVLACAAILQAPAPLPALPTGPGSVRYEWLFADAALTLPPQDASVTTEVPPSDDDTPPSAEDLEAVACAVTAVKLLFCGGALARATALAAVAHAWVTATSCELHETVIRNEAAYGTCIHLLLTRHAPPVPPAAPEEQPVYVLGDSHVLPCAWRSITVNGQSRMMVPCLVTGVKAYHLRPQSTFYPKRQWERACARLPPGATVMVLVGEIDCREGMLRAIEKGCAPDIATAARDVAQLLVDALIKNLLTGRSRASTVLVHPVPPVLDVTHTLVLAFNSALGAAVARAKPAHSALRWLGGDETDSAFVGRLLTSDGSALRTEYVLDGTHLNPAYISDVLQEAIDSSR